MFELRWAVQPSTTTKLPVLQWRHSFAIDASGALCPGEFTEWMGVPIAVVPVKPSKDSDDEKLLRHAHNALELALQFGCKQITEVQSTFKALSHRLGLD